MGGCGCGCQIDLQLPNCPLSPHCVCVLCLYTLLCARAEAAGGEYLHKYWTKTGRNSRTATGLILDKYFTRPTNTAGGGGRGVRGVENEQHLGKHTEVRRGGVVRQLLPVYFHVQQRLTSDYLAEPRSPNMKCQQMRDEDEEEDIYRFVQDVRSNGFYLPKGKPLGGKVLVAWLARSPLCLRQMGVRRLMSRWSPRCPIVPSGTGQATQGTFITVSSLFLQHMYINIAIHPQKIQISSIMSL